MTAIRLVLPLLLIIVMAGCSRLQEVQSAIHPAGRGADQILDLWWLLALISGFVFLLVLALLAWGLFRPRRPDEPVRHASVLLWLGLGAVGMPVGLLAVILVFTLFIMNESSKPEQLAQENLVVQVVGHRWWWEVNYEHAVPQRRVTTANEIVIPVGVPVQIKLESRDVIHSFWVPNLQGKTDLVPGRVNTTWIEAEEPGVFRGQCSEFCGLQHANMAFLVVALPAEQFASWYEAQLQEAVAPIDELAAEGQRVFLEKPCAMCHAVRGTLALASVGPDLTHIASRRMLAAGTLPNVRGYLAGWITDPQGLKPGAAMPNIDLTSEELLALVAYLETLR